MTNTVRASNISAILAVGEELRQLLHAEDPPIIKDRRYHLKVYENCFVGHEMVDWLLRKGESGEQSRGICDDHEFKDEKLFFRFRRDDNTYEEPPDAMIVAKGQRIYSRYIDMQSVVSDPVGYGFVIRGSRPVYVHTVDPSGPAASAGLQVREYLHYVNGQDVLDKSHTDVARIILMGSSTASLVTFVEKDRLPSN
ncbi:DEP domain-containing mTOR-interacting protein-like [Gigantopelta aegis]|uniref:DEP domain-containing mTOR-interacting protein-like n=1 Tax=Gigantopelta aegis TaxID=1735272 RepID=UPI001B88CDED|nr:DEP domain-containing mTOR-interacting protein-like [Gigantopelta aegis]